MPCISKQLDDTLYETVNFLLFTIIKGSSEGSGATGWLVLLKRVHTFSGPYIARPQSLQR